MKITIHARANASKNSVERVGELEYKVWTVKTPEKGEANEAIIKLLSQHLDIPKTSVTLLSGKKSRIKTFEIG